LREAERVLGFDDVKHDKPTIEILLETDRIMRIIRMARDVPA
jgi:hypothetical protein